jgi:putative transposase
LALYRVGDFAAFLDQDFDETAAFGPPRKAELVGRPVGAAEWIKAMETRTGKTLAPGRRGPKPKGGPGD